MENFMSALTFAARKHRFQKRKDLQSTPYINHPISVAHILSNEAHIHDYEILSAALLHDTIEDTETTLEELEKQFGPRIAGIVHQLSDDKTLDKLQRKRLQIEIASKLTPDAILVRLADKIDNLRDLNRAVPIGWTDERVQEYFQWSAQIARQLVGHNAQMDQILADLFQQRNISLT